MSDHLLMCDVMPDGTPPLNAEAEAVEVEHLSGGGLTLFIGNGTRLIFAERDAEELRRQVQVPKVESEAA